MTDQLTTPAPSAVTTPAPSPATASTPRRRRTRRVGPIVRHAILIIASLVFYKPAFMLIVAVAVVVAIWELHRGFQAKGIDLPQEPLMLGGVVMVAVAFYAGPPSLVTATAVTGRLAAPADL